MQGSCKHSYEMQGFIKKKGEYAEQLKNWQLLRKSFAILNITAIRGHTARCTNISEDLCNIHFALCVS
jgi:hypothetical protein